MTIATVILIAILAIMGIMITDQGHGTVFPPTSNTCPDYWLQDATGMCYFPLGKDAKNIGIIDASANSPSSSVAPFAFTSTDSSLGAYYLDPKNKSWNGMGKTSICAQREWATKNSIVWDGVTNYNSC